LFALQLLEPGADGDHPLRDGTHLGKGAVSLGGSEGASHEGEFILGVDPGSGAAATRLRLVWWSTLVGVLIALEYASRFSAGTPDRDVLYRYSTAAAAAAAYAILLVLALAIAGFRRDLLALHRPRSWGRALLLMGAVLVLIWISVAILDQFLHGGREQGLTPTGWEPGHAGAYAANFVVIALFAPVVEELIFRGLGFSLLVPFGVWPAIVGVGVAFALAHGLLQAFPELAVFGCALAWLRWRTASVYPGMIVHGLFNGVALIVAVTVGG
jgi:membrane protease YdiL (CAAX protease family)